MYWNTGSLEQHLLTWHKSCENITEAFEWTKLCFNIGTNISIFTLNCVLLWLVWNDQNSANSLKTTNTHTKKWDHWRLKTPDVVSVLKLEAPKSPRSPKRQHFHSGSDTVSLSFWFELKSSLRTNMAGAAGRCSRASRAEQSARVQRISQGQWSNITTCKAIGFQRCSSSSTQQLKSQSAIRRKKQ